LQEVDKIYHTHIIISDKVQIQLSSDYITRPLDVVSVKGKTQKIKIYELVGKVDAQLSIQPAENLITLCQLFTQAHLTLEQGKTQEAIEQFEHIASLYPDDFPTKMYLERLKPN
jgi:adenylate cyclase